MNFNLIIPAAADKKEYNNKMPFIFNLNDEGIMLCIKAILGLELNKFSSIYFTILKSHSETYCLKEMFELQFKRLKLNKAKVVIIDKETNNQAETIYQTIQQEHITEGSIYIKDADCYFESEVIAQNGITIYPLESLNMVNPQNKSYIAVDDMYYVTNIIEKKIISHFFNAGGYCFEDVKEFCKYYLRLKDCSHLYLSHIIFTMLLDKHIFRPLAVKHYIDYEAEFSRE